VTEAYEALRNHNVGYHHAGYGTFKGVTFQKVARTEGMEMGVFYDDNTQAQNWLKRHAQKSKYIGIKQQKNGNWTARVYNGNGESSTVGTFDLDVDAAFARDEAVREGKLKNLKRLNFTSVELALTQRA
jgi:hypothetical protein